MTTHARPAALLFAIALAACGQQADEEPFCTITIASPENGTSTSNVFVTMRGAIIPPDARAIEVRWENTATSETGRATVVATGDPLYPIECFLSPFPCAPTGWTTTALNWRAEVPLATGANHIRVTALDVDGRSARAELDVSHVPGPPTIRILRPDDGSSAWTVRFCRKDVAVAATGAVSLRLRNETTGQEWTSGPATYWPVYARLVPGANRFVASATGTNGDVVEDEVVLTLVDPIDDCGG